MALPVLAIGGIVAALVVIYLSRREKYTIWSAVGAVVVLLAGLAITLTIHFPINHAILGFVLLLILLAPRVPSPSAERG